MAKASSTTRGELGGSGITIYQGVISGVEYNPNLDTEYGGSGLSIYERMRKGDPVVKSALNIVKLGLLQAEWVIKSDDEVDQELIDFSKEALFQRLDIPFQETLKDILTYLDFGFYVGEKVFKLEDGKIWWSRIAYRDQKSIMRFETDDHKPGVLQQLNSDLNNQGTKQVSIPWSKLFHFANDKEGDNFRGVSLLRAAYKPWFFKEAFEKIDAIGFEREAVGLPVFTMPANPNKEDVDKAEEIGKNIRANEKAHVILPAGWTLETQYPTGTRRDGNENIRRFNRDVFANVLAQFLDLGSGSTGSRALSVDQSDAFYKSLQATGDYISSILTKGLEQLIDLNFDTVKKYPKIEVTGIERLELDSFSNAIQRLVLSRVITPDSDLEDWLRKQLRLPDRIPADQIDMADEQRRNPLAVAIQNGMDQGGNNNGGNNNEPSGNKNNQDNKDKNAADSGGGGKPPVNNLKKNSEIAKTKRFFEGFRPLTFAEEKINFDSLRRQMDFLEEKTKTDLQVVLAPEIQSLLTDARVALQSGDVKRAEDLTLRYKDTLREFLLNAFKNAFEAGKLSASNELKVPSPRNTQDVINLLTTRANTIADYISNDLLQTAKINLVQLIQSQSLTPDGLKSLDNILNDGLIQSIALTSSVVTSGGINQGRDSIFDQFPEKIYSLQRSELLDSRVCDYCISMDGRTVNQGDPITKIDQFHFQCRGIWVEILDEEPNKPDISGIPDNLRERVGTLTQFQQIDKPMPLPGSLAADFVNNQ